MLSNKKKSENSSHKQSVFDWWNSDNTKKWHTTKYEKDNIEYLHVIDRLDRALDYIKQFKPEKNCKILEFGFGGGQSSHKILELGYNYTGVEISKHMISSAEEKCSKYIKDKKAFFFHGSLDEVNEELTNNTYDVVLICGALQYTDDINFAISEIHKLLKKDGVFIICQANMFAIHEFIGFRKFLKTIVRYITNEDFFYSYSNSFKSILLETNLKKYFRKFENSKFMNSKFMTKYEEKWDYKINKRLFSSKKLSNHLVKNSFKIINKTGAPFFLYHNNKIINYLFRISNKILLFSVKYLRLNFLTNMADNIIIVSKKNV
jgi:SAM-dependent methyltransferase